MSDVHKKSVEFYFDFGSPATYLAASQLPHLCADTGAELVWRPMLLGGVFQATGNHSPATIPAKGPYLFDDLRRFAKRYAVPFRYNPDFPINTLTLMRMAVGLQMHEPDRLKAFADAVFDAMWVEPRNLNDAATVGAVLTDAGFDAAKMAGLAADPAVKQGLKTATEEAVGRGIFGAPTMFVDGEMFWGQDRLDFVREALQEAEA